MRLGCVLLIVVVGSVCAIATADVFTRFASYEPSETALSVAAAAGDAGLSVAIVQGGLNGAPAATDGTHLVKLTITNETDRKVEFRHFLNGATYDLAGQNELLADVYFSSAGSLPGVMGIFEGAWNPPSAWQPVGAVPQSAGSWVTVSYNVATREQTGLNQIWAMVFEDLASASGTVYVDNLRFRADGGVASPVTGVAVVGLDTSNEIYWKPISPTGFEGFNIYGADAAFGPFTKLNDAPIADARYIECPLAIERGPRFYYVTSVAAGQESANSATVSAEYNGLTDDELMDLVQRETFRYFWDFANPNSGMARESVGLGHPASTVTTGGTGFGMITIVVGAERGFVTRAEAADRLLRMIRFLDGVNPVNPALPSGVQRYHGVWSHWINGNTGATIAFAGAMDNGGDLVETAFLIQGMLTVRQYFDDPNDAIETELRDRITEMWEEVEWDWYRQSPTSGVLYWHWSPNFGFALNHAIRGYNEAQIIYLLAVASPTHAVPASLYHFGWAGRADYTNGTSYYGIPLPVGYAFGGPLFFTHYSNLGFDPRYKRDTYANYFVNSQAFSGINRAYCIDNPDDHVGYSPLNWGLTASASPFGYSAHSPTNDNGTITPTAAISAMPYLPYESLRTMRHMYDEYGDFIFSDAGFRDAFHLGQGWVANGYLAIDQGTIVPMIENHRTGLC
ncbi:MAG: glucoamylase family protein, partial [Phycisphaerae bacterium]